MTEQNSTLDQIIRPEQLMEELGVKKDAYYADLKYLGIKADKDDDGKAYLTDEEAEKVKALRSHVIKTGKRDGFVYGGLAVSNNNELATNSISDDIYVEPEEPTSSFDINELMREAAELKAREIAMASLVKRELADRMTEDDLPTDLQEKVAIAREAANPKWKPADVAQTLLAQYRSQKDS